jgi:hypothetical protein
MSVCRQVAILDNPLFCSPVSGIGCDVRFESLVVLPWCQLFTPLCSPWSPDPSVRFNKDSGEGRPGGWAPGGGVIPCPNGDEGTRGILLGGPNIPGLDPTHQKTVSSFVTRIASRRDGRTIRIFELCIADLYSGE